MVGYDDCFVAGFLGCFDCAHETFVDCHYCFFDGFIDAGVAYHVAVGVVDNDKVIFFRAYGFREFAAHLVCAHFGFQVVCGDFGRGNQDALFVFIRGFTSAVEEEGHMGILFSLGDMKLVFALLCHIFSEGIVHVFFVEKDVYAGE